MPNNLVAKTENDYRNLKPGRHASIDSMRLCDKMGLPSNNTNWIKEYAAMDDFILLEK